jgi:hypothetical protein
MKLVTLTLSIVLVMATGSLCFAQRDAKTSTARAAYGKPTASLYSSSKKKKRHKKVRTKDGRRRNQRDTDEARSRRHSIGM